MAKEGPHHGRYILQGKIPVPCEDLLEWARWSEQHREDRIVKQQEVGRFWVSTVFLTLDHSRWDDDGPPLVFETMIFENREDRRRETAYDAPMERTSTWELALEAHAEAVAWAREQLS